MRIIFNYKNLVPSEFLSPATEDSTISAILSHLPIASSAFSIHMLSCPFTRIENLSHTSHHASIPQIKKAASCRSHCRKTLHHSATLCSQHVFCANSYYTKKEEARRLLSSILPAILLRPLLRCIVLLDASAKIPFTAESHKESPERWRMPHRQSLLRTAASHWYSPQKHPPQ